MVLITELNGRSYYLNFKLIEQVIPDEGGTILKLTSSNTIRVKNSPEDVVQQIKDYERYIHQQIEVIG